MWCVIWEAFTRKSADIYELCFVTPTLLFLYSKGIVEFKFSISLWMHIQEAWTFVFHYFINVTWGGRKKFDKLINDQGQNEHGEGQESWKKQKQESWFFRYYVSFIHCIIFSIVQWFSQLTAKFCSCKRRSPCEHDSQDLFTSLNIPKVMSISKWWLVFVFFDNSIAILLSPSKNKRLSGNPAKQILQWKQTNGAPKCSNVL